MRRSPLRTKWCGRTLVLCLALILFNLYYLGSILMAPVECGFDIPAEPLVFEESFETDPVNSEEYAFRYDRETSIKNIEMVQTVTSYKCIRVEAFRCSRLRWAQVGNSFQVTDSLDPVFFKAVPGTLFNNSVMFVACNSRGEVDNKMYLVHTGCGVELREVDPGSNFEAQLAASFYLNADRYIHGFLAIEAASMLGHYITTGPDGYLKVVSVDSSGGFRVSSSWRIKSWDDEGMFQAKGNVHVLVQVPMTGSPVTHSEGPDKCLPALRGCCYPGTRSLPPVEERNNKATEKEQTAVTLVISNAKMFAKRRAIIEDWLLNPLQDEETRKKLLWKHAVITLDCPLKAEDFTNLKHVEWLVGPMGNQFVVHLDIPLRVSMALHWTFDHFPDVAWFFMVDDDTLVFTSNIAADIPLFSDPFNEVWYIGHTSEWNVKLNFHGDFAFGGGGVLLSNKARQHWKRHWHGPLDIAAKRWTESGLCSHDGGDGAICRCLLEAVPDRRIFYNHPGFHQFDIVGTPTMLALVENTCPKCPSMHEQTGLWIDGVIGRRPVLSLHHLAAITVDSVFPGLDGIDTTHRLLAGYKAHPPALFLRRVCGSIPKLITLCINFGHRIQVFDPELSPEEATVLVNATRGGVPAVDRIDFLSPMPKVERHYRCSFHFFPTSDDPDVVHYVSTKTRAKNPPSHDIACASGEARLTLRDTYLATINLTLPSGETAQWSSDLSGLETIPLP